MIFYVLIAIVVLLLMIVIHELGHYVAGKILKFKINEFSIGFGPKIFSHKNKKTGEVFSLRAIPLGGFCAFEDEDGLANADSEAKEIAAQEVFDELKPVSVMPTPIEELRERENPTPKPRSFTQEKPWKRIIVLFSGALFNFVSAILFSFIFIWVMGYTVPKVDTLYFDELGSAYASELREGDIIRAVNGEEITVMKSYDELMQNRKEGTEYILTVDRNGEILDVKVTMQRVKTQVVDADGNTQDLDYTGLGFMSQNIAVDGNFVDAIKYCVPYTFKLAFLVLATIGGLFTCAVPLTSVSGPVGTVGFMAQLGSYDLRYFLMLLPLIAANLAVFNILPIPALDGSKIIFTTIEWIRGKPLNRKVESIIHAVGMLLLFAFVIIIDLVGIFV